MVTDTDNGPMATDGRDNAQGGQGGQGASSEQAAADRARMAAEAACLRQGNLRLAPTYQGYERGRLDGLTWAASCATLEDLQLTDRVLRRYRSPEADSNSGGTGANRGDARRASTHTVSGRALQRSLDALHSGGRCDLPPLPGWTAQRLLTWPPGLWLGATLDAQTPPTPTTPGDAEDERAAHHRRGDARYWQAIQALGPLAPYYLAGWRDGLTALHRDLRWRASQAARAERDRACGDQAQEHPEEQAHDERRA